MSQSRQTRQAFRYAASTVVDLLRAPEVAAKWSAPSALAEFAVSGLAGHLALQVLNVPLVLADHRSGQEAPIGLLDHYARVAWVDAELDDEVNVGIRDSGEAAAAKGVEALTDEVAEVVGTLDAALSAESSGRVVYLPWTGWSLRLEHFLITRMMEIAVHSDDLAVSVGIAAPVLPPAVLDPVTDLLVRLSVRRHGQAAVLRALARSERAPENITAF
jgi:hypothetical protein